jgi:hypothetical protein
VPAAAPSEQRSSRFTVKQVHCEEEGSARSPTAAVIRHVANLPEPRRGGMRGPAVGPRANGFLRPTLAAQAGVTARKGQA